MPSVSKRGRPPKYRPEFVERARSLCLLGLTDDELARHFSVSRNHFDKWRHRFPELGDAIAWGRDQADGQVAAALFKRALGYNAEQSKVDRSGNVVTWTEHIPGDFNAMSLILRNRQAARWREKTVVEHDISDRVADRLDAARLRMLGQLAAPTVIEHEADPISAQQPSNPRAPDE